MFTVTRANELLASSSVLPDTHASFELAFDAALDAATEFLKLNIRGTFVGDDEQPRTTARHKMWVENRAGTDKGCHLSYDFHDGEDYQTNVISWVVAEV